MATPVDLPSRIENAATKEVDEFLTENLEILKTLNPTILEVVNSAFIKGARFGCAFTIQELTENEAGVEG